MTKTKEIDYYPLIAEKLRNELRHALSELGEFIVDFQPCGTVDLASGIKRVADRNGLSLQTFEISPEMVRGLFVDIMGYVYSKEHKRGILIICEVKPSNLSLTDLAQLIGYCFASRASFGLLIGVGGRVSRGFENILKKSPHLLNFKIVGKTCNLGIGWWDSNTKEFIFDSFGKMDSFIDLSRFVAKELTQIT